MGIPKELKGKLGNLLIIIGMIVMVASLSRWVLLNQIQKSLMAEHEVSHPDILPGEQEGEEVTVITEDRDYDTPPSQDIYATKGRKPKELFKRENYEDGMMIIEIPKIKVQAAVIEGTQPKDLRKGPGLYDISPLPDDMEGNVCIAGHRTTYGAWFRHVDELEEGDDIILTFNDAIYLYKVERVFIVDKKDWSVTEAIGYPAITLTACHPLRSSRQRIVVRGKQIGLRD